MIIRWDDEHELESVFGTKVEGLLHDGERPSQISVGTVELSRWLEEEARTSGEAVALDKLIVMLFHYNHSIKWPSNP
jgi:hypothetical protein